MTAPSDPIPLHCVFEALSNPVMVLSHELKVVRSNRAAQPYLNDLDAMLGFAKGLIDSKTYPTDTDPPFIHSLISVHSGVTDKATLQCQWQRPDATVTLNVELCLIHQEATLRHYLLSLADITPLVEVRQQMAHAAKLASIGEMAAGIAHELNQPLNVIRMASQNLRRATEKGSLTPERVAPKLERIQQQIERATHIVSSLRLFGHPDDFEPQRLRASSTVASGLALVAEQLEAAGIAIDYKPLDNDVYVMADENALAQVVVNLLENARDAVLVHHPEGARISLREQADEHFFALTVEDNGGGISEETLDHLFEPFFTTKKVGTATGLGLAISYGAVSALGGDIRAANTASGARFTVRLPLAEQQSP